jgi:hypothetical protein
MTKLTALIEEIVDDCAGKYRKKRVERLDDLTPAERAPLFAAVIEDNLDIGWSFCDELNNKELLERLAMLMRADDSETSSANLFKDQLKKIMQKQTASYIDKLFAEAWEAKEASIIADEQAHGFYRTNYDEIERIDFNRFCR